MTFFFEIPTLGRSFVVGISIPVCTSCAHCYQLTIVLSMFCFVTQWRRLWFHHAHTHTLMQHMHQKFKTQFDGVTRVKIDNRY